MMAFLIEGVGPGVPALQLESRWRGARGCHGPSSALATAYIGRRAIEPRATEPRPPYAAAAR